MSRPSGSTAITGRDRRAWRQALARGTSPGRAASPLSRLRRLVLRALVPAVLAVVLLAGGALVALEADTVSSFGDGVLWALSLMMTVGFTGGVPHTAVAKVLAALLMVLGFGILAVTTAAIASLFVRDDEEPIERREADFERAVMGELASLSARLEGIEGRLVASPARRPSGVRPLPRPARWAPPPRVCWEPAGRSAGGPGVRATVVPSRRGPQGRPAPEAA